MKKVFLAIKNFIMRLIKYFLPKPPAAPEGSKVVTKKGIIIKAIILQSFVFLGIIARILVIKLSPYAGPLGATVSLGVEVDFYTKPTTMLDLIIFAFATLLLYAMPFLRYIHSWLPGTGPLYAFNIGYVFVFMINVTAEQSVIGLWVALGSSVLFAALPFYLFKFKHYVLPKYTAKVTYVAFFIFTLGGSIVGALSYIPFLSGIAGKIKLIYKLYPIKLINGSMSIIVAFLFMILALDTMRTYLHRGVKQKYEWLITFTVFYTVAVSVTRIHEIVNIACQLYE